jgi:hypothetical protein
MEGRDLADAVLPFVVALALGWGSWLVFRQRGGSGSLRVPGRPGAGPAVAPRDRGRADRPWWGNPWLWVGVAAVFVVLGIFVWPGLVGGVVLFLPFVWVSRPRAPDVDPRSNGHGRRHDPTGG